MSNLKLITNNHITGQDSERNLVAAISKATFAAPDEFFLGDLGNHNVMGAAVISGGLPEPKSDIVIKTLDREIGISMKKNNYEFLESWMDEAKLRGRLQTVGFDEPGAKVIIDGICDIIEELTRGMSEVIKQERTTFERYLKKMKPDYVFPQPISIEEKDQIAADNILFECKGKFRNPYHIANFYIPLSKLLGDAYYEFIKLVIAGDENDKKPAEGILVADIYPGGTIKELRQSLSLIQSVENAAKEQEISFDMWFRLRPVTKVRTTYSRTNRNKYKIGQRLWEDPDLGVSWTVSVAR